MTVNLQGFEKQLNKKFEDLSLPERVQEFVINTVRDVILDFLKRKDFQDWIAARVSACAEQVGIALTFTDITNKAATKADFDRAITARINTLAGTAFTSIQGIKKEDIKIEAGRVLGEKLGMGPLYPVENFRVAVGQNLVQSFEGTAPVALFSPSTLQAIEEKVVKRMTPLSDVALHVGNPMGKAGAPVDAKEAAARADNRRRQAKYRRKNTLRWVPLGDGGGANGNGREGLTGKDSGNVKPVRQKWDQSMYGHTRDN